MFLRQSIKGYRQTPRKLPISHAASELDPISTSDTKTKNVFIYNPYAKKSGKDGSNKATVNSF